MLKGNNALSHDSLEKNKPHLLHLSSCLLSIPLMAVCHCCHLHSCVFVLPTPARGAQCHSGLPTNTVTHYFLLLWLKHLLYTLRPSLWLWGGSQVQLKNCKIFLSSHFFLTSIISSCVLFLIGFDFPAFALSWELPHTYFPSECWNQSFFPSRFPPRPMWISKSSVCVHAVKQTL